MDTPWALVLLHGGGGFAGVGWVCGGFSFGFGRACQVGSGLSTELSSINVALCCKTSPTLALGGGSICSLFDFVSTSIGRENNASQNKTQADPYLPGSLENKFVVKELHDS